MSKLVEVRDKTFVFDDGTEITCPAFWVKEIPKAELGVPADSTARYWAVGFNRGSWTDGTAFAHGIVLTDDPGQRDGARAALLYMIDECNDARSFAERDRDERLSQAQPGSSPVAPGSP